MTLTIVRAVLHVSSLSKLRINATDLDSENFEVEDVQTCVQAAVSGESQSCIASGAGKRTYTAGRSGAKQRQLCVTAEASASRENLR